MIAETSRNASRAHTARPLRRGRACMNCRFLKIRCDGVKPICGPCLRHPKDDVCEYSDGQGRSRTKVLEDTVHRLEARLHELENPDASTPSVKLHDPYNSSQRHSKSPLRLSVPAPFSPISPFSPTSTASSLPPWNSLAALSATTESTGSSGPSGSRPSGSRPSGSSGSPTRPHSTPPFLGAEEPPFLVLNNLLDNFLPHSSEFGFFLDIPRFYNSALLPLSFGHQSRPSPALLSAVYLWGVHLSRSEPLLAYEYIFLTRALQHTATDLFGVHPHKVLHTLQAETLLSYYFLRTGRFLEAKIHTGAAVSLAIGSGFHKIRSSNLSAPSTIGLLSDTPVLLHAPHDNVEEGERINGFWSVFMLHKMVAVTLESPSSVCGAFEAPGMQIDTPWPLDSGSYKEGRLHSGVQGSFTVRNFLGNWDTSPQSGFSAIATTVKASIILHRAAHLTGQWAPNMSQRDSQAFAAAFQSVNRLIDGFRVNLPPLADLDATASSARTTLLAHALTDAATIKLHSIFAYANPFSKQNCLAAARNMVGFGGVNLQEIGYMNPIMGTLWTTACHVFIDEISRVRALPEEWPPTPSEMGEEELMENLRNGITALSLFSEDSTLMRHQLTKIQEAFSAI